MTNPFRSSGDSPESSAPPKFTVPELMALGRLAGYSDAEIAQKILDADEQQKEAADEASPV